MRIRKKNIRFLKKWSSVQIITVGFLLLTLVGASILSLPISSSNGQPTNFVDSLFTATSAVCVTGLVVFDTATHWSLFGKVVIISLIQIGGLGFMTIATMISLIRGKKINLKDDGLVLSEKAARVIGASVGDTIKLKNSDNITVEAKVSDITENYISHYAYMTKNYYNKLFNNIPSNNKVLGILNRTSSKEEDKLSKELINIDGVSGVVFNTVSKQTFSNTIKNLNYVVLIMIISAGSLAFVVLYNLTNVNISERIREIATIKVLGFYDGETAAYIYRENIILTIVGIIVGLIMGKFLHQYIMTTVEIKSMMFGRVINTKSYIIAAILTVLLSLIVNVVMYYKLKNVKMVESLKSVD